MSKSSESDIAVPHVSFEAARKVTLALYAFKKTGSARDIVGLVDLNTTNTSKALSVAKSLGFVVETERGYYDLTKTGREFARLVEFGKTSDATNLVKDALLNRDEWSEIIAFLRASEKNPRDPLDLVLHIESRTDKQWKTSMRNSLASMYRSVLIGGGLIKPDEPKIVSLLQFETQDSSKPISRSTPKSTTANLEAISDNGKSESFVFSMPDLFSFEVRATKKALQKLREQIMDGSPMAIWIDASIETLDERNSEEQD